MKLKIFIALLVALAPALASASPRSTPSAHLRPQLFHDRTPKAHLHESHPHHV